MVDLIEFFATNEFLYVTSCKCHVPYTLHFRQFVFGSSAVCKGRRTEYIQIIRWVFDSGKQFHFAQFLGIIECPFTYLHFLCGTRCRIDILRNSERAAQIGMRKCFFAYLLYVIAQLDTFDMRISKRLIPEINPVRLALQTKVYILREVIGAIETLFSEIIGRVCRALDEVLRQGNTLDAGRSEAFLAEAHVLPTGLLSAVNLYVELSADVFEHMPRNHHHFACTALIGIKIDFLDRTSGERIGIVVHCERMTFQHDLLNTCGREGVVA